MEKSHAIAAVCRALSDDAHDDATAVLREHYPFAPDEIIKRKYGPAQATRVFVRDGFIDRYSGNRLIFPPVLRVLSIVLPVDFPYHPNWKTNVTHPAYWEVAATVDHLVPITRGGSDDEQNWLTTSMARNYAKLSWSLEQLGWNLYPPGNLSDWDGLIHWFLGYTDQHPETLSNSSLRQWHRAAKSVLYEVR